MNLGGYGKLLNMGNVFKPNFWHKKFIVFSIEGIKIIEKFVVVFSIFLHSKTSATFYFSTFGTKSLKLLVLGASTLLATMKYKGEDLYE